jgi:ABC-type transport system involved in multi-copper enzyme maturation permease subunit
MNLQHHVTCIRSIAVTTFREAIRDRILHGIVVLAVALVLLSIAFGQLSVENDARVIRDLGTTFTSLIIVTVAVFSGVSLLHKEIHRQTIYTIVTKPVARWAFIIGKYLGLVLTLAAVELVIGLVLFAIIALRGDPLHVVLFQSLFLAFVEGALVAAVATLFSSFSTPFLSGLFTIGVFLVGRLREQIYEYASAIKVGVLPDLIRAVGVVVPDLSLHRADVQVAYLVSLNWSYVAYTVGYTAAYIAVLITLASVIFSRRDFV